MRLGGSAADSAPSPLNRKRLLNSGFGSAAPRFDGACVTSLGMIHTLFASPWAIWGSTWRYW